MNTVNATTANSSMLLQTLKQYTSRAAEKIRTNILTTQSTSPSAADSLKEAIKAMDQNTSSNGPLSSLLRYRRESCSGRSAIFSNEAVIKEYMRNTRSVHRSLDIRA